MIDDMSVRNLSPATQRSYLHAVSKFSRHFGRSPDRLGLEDVRAFPVYLVSQGISWPALNQTVCFTASSLNSRLNFRRFIVTLRFRKHLISVSTKPAAAQISQFELKLMHDHLRRICKFQDIVIRFIPAKVTKYTQSQKNKQAA
jgi:hypothetical protein